MADFMVIPIAQFESWLISQKVSRLIKLIQIHHTWKPNYSSFQHSDHKSLLKSMEKSHLERGFTAIAQHFTIFPDGQIGTGRPLNQVPAGIKGANQNGICIEIIGNFDHGGDILNDIQSESIIKVTTLLCKKFNLVPSDSTIVYHHWYDLNSGVRTNGEGTTKTCPGTNFFGGNTVADFNEHFLPVIVQAIGETPQVTTHTYLFVGSVIPSKLNVRSNSSINAGVVDKLTRGTEVRIFSDHQDWFSINGSYTRWVKKEFIEVLNA